LEHLTKDYSKTHPGMLFADDAGAMYKDKGVGDEEDWSCGKM